MAIDLERIEEAPHILDILLQTEDILDSLDVYCYKNWFDGEVVDGPVVRRHWISISLLYPHHKMPDPRAALRLLKHDVIVEFSKVQQNGGQFHALADSNAGRPMDGQPQSGAASVNPAAGDPSVGANPDDAMAPAVTAGTAEPAHAFWMIKIAFPRRLLAQMGTDLSFYDDEVDSEDVESAKDAGIDDESGYNAEEQAPGQAADAPPGGDPTAGGFGADPAAAGFPPPPGGQPANG